MKHVLEAIIRFRIPRYQIAFQIQMMGMAKKHIRAALTNAPRAVAQAKTTTTSTVLQTSTRTIT